jgi:uncharacterized protein (DUF2147 family)
MRSSVTLRRLGVWAAGLAGLICLHTGAAQELPLGLWKTYDDTGQKAQAMVRITEADGRLVGHIVDILDPEADPQARCDKCPPPRRGQPLRGLQIISGVDPRPQGQVWKQGVILDPEEGREYRLELEWSPASTQLKLRGYWGPFWRTQVWRRAP